jgi:hypothetical protein
MLMVNKHTKSTIDLPPHNLFVYERDINKKITLLEKISFKNVEKIINNVINHKD